MTGKRFLAAAAALCFLLPATASAYWPWHGPIAGGYGGYDNGYVYPFFYRVRSIPTPPYFALHPPVYYGPRLLMRPYGNSPWAYPSTYERQGFIPYTAQAEVRVAPQPLLIHNPFVAQPEGQPRAQPAAPRTEAFEEGASQVIPNDSHERKLVANPHVRRG